MPLRVKGHFKFAQFNGIIGRAYDDWHNKCIIKFVIRKQQKSLMMGDRQIFVI